MLSRQIFEGQEHLNPAQRAVVEHGFLTSGFSTVLQMPTGAGKTWLSEQAIAATLTDGARAIYLTPLRALANELVERWSRRFQDFDVGVFTGEYGRRQSYPVPFEKARLLIMTPERLDACTRCWRHHWRWFPEVSLLVVDELHLLGEAGRGPRLEGALMRARRLNPFLRVLGLSATLGNRAELAEWLGGVHFESTWRPFPIQWRCARFRKAIDKPEILRGEVKQCVERGGQSLVFVQSRRRAEALSTQLCDAGIAAGHHHAGLESKDRSRLEAEFRDGTIRALISTGTLEMGLNLPARQVILYDLQAFDGTNFVPLSVNTVWQRAGRAGRRGFDTQGEVVLMSPSWDREADRYVGGRFEPIISGLADARALAEQILAEVSSGLARTRTQLNRNLQQTLAAYQRGLPEIDCIVDEMLAGGMLVEVQGQERGPILKTTRIGQIAVRQMLTPTTVAALAQAFQMTRANDLTFLDILVLCARTDDCEPVIPVDFEELNELDHRLSNERSVLLSEIPAQIAGRLELRGRRLLAAIKSALIIRDWTRTGDAEGVAERFSCYAFEVRRLSESFSRILSAAIAILTPPADQKHEEERTICLRQICDELRLLDRVRALASMVAHGLDEETVTLTFLGGLGGTLARRLRDVGICHIEDMALSEVNDVARVHGISAIRATRWIDEATKIIQVRSAFSFRETGPKVQSQSVNVVFKVDPYRVRRALDLKVRRQGDTFLVSGGLEPHRVEKMKGEYRCDCADHAKGHACKHTLAVRLHMKDPQLLSLVENVQSDRTLEGLDLIRLWFDGAKR